MQILWFALTTNTALSNKPLVKLFKPRPKFYMGCIKKKQIPWNNGNRHPRWGVAEIQKMSPPTTVGDAADMQLCVIKQGSPPVLENVAFFVTDLLTLARCAVCILNISVGME